MTKQKSTKRALLMSALSLLMCVSMLIGSTFAWFTDSVTSGSNVITAGNLDIEVTYTLGDTDSEGAYIWNNLDGANDLFQKGLWEPGHTEVVVLRIENKGTLAAKYEAQMNIVNETYGKNKDGNDIILSDILTVETNVVAEDKQFASNNDTALWIAFNWEEMEWLSTPVPFKSDRILNVARYNVGVKDAECTQILPGDAHYVVVMVDMDETVGNEANHDGVNVPSIEFGINVLATQYTYEYDSFGNQYDKDAKYPGQVETAEELAVALANNESVVLLNDIDLTGEWEPIGDKDAGVYYTGTLDGAGYTIRGMSVSNGDYVALISAAKDATIKNLTVEGTVAGKNAAGIVARVEGGTVIENCVSNVTVSGTTKAGGIACNVTGADAKIINCTNNGAVSGGDSGIGGIVGYVNNDANLEILKCTNTGNITSDNNKYAGAAVGYAAGTSTGKVASMTNSGTVTGTVLSDGRYLKYDGTVLCGYVGTIGNWEAGFVVADTVEFQAALDNAQSGAIVWLENDAKYDSVVMDANVKNVTIKGAEGAVVGNINLNGSNGTTLSGITFDAAGAQKCVDNKAERAYGCIISGTKSTSIGARDLVVENCTFTGTFANGGAAIVLADRGRASGGSADVTVKGCTFGTVGAWYDVYGYYTGGEAASFNIEGNTFASETSGTSIYLGRLKTSENITVSGNIFENKANITDAVYVAGDSGYTPTLVAEGNTFAD